MQNDNINDKFWWLHKWKQNKKQYHPYRILIIGGSGSGKINTFINLINQQPDTDKVYLFAKDPYESKY